MEKERDNEIMTVNELAKYLRMTPMTIYRMAQQGQIPASKVFGSWRFNRDEIMAWIKNQEVQSSKILVIDDDPEIGVMLRKALERKHKVKVVETAHDALAVLDKEKFNMIFLDLKLPDMDGLSLYRMIKEHKKNIPVVVITGTEDTDMIAKIVIEGAKFVLNKPFTVAEIRQMLNFIKT